MPQDAFETLTSALFDRRPFQAFTIVLANGNRFEVDHPRAMVTRDGVAVFLGPGGVPVWFDHESVSEIVGDAAGTQN